MPYKKSEEKNAKKEEKKWIFFFCEGEEGVFKLDFVHNVAI